MKLSPVLFSIVLLAAACSVEDSDQAAATEVTENSALMATGSALDISAEIAHSRAAIQEFASSLQVELATAMQSGDPVAAIHLCNTEANLITAKVSGNHGLNLGRVSLKNRNPANYPNDWQAQVLLDFENRKAAGESVEGLEWSDVVRAGERQEFRYMKAIPTRASCLQCHGVELAPGVKEALADLYPRDLGTGFREGDIRGAFVARGVLAQ